MRILRHVIIVAAAVFLLVGLPVIQTGYLTRLISGADTIASATVIIDQPSGGYIVLINKDLHTNTENLAVWEDFFSGKEIGFLFEDIRCTVADSDPAGLELAKSFQSRLPENQMALRTEDITLLFSKVHTGQFDVVLISKEVYDAYRAGSLVKNDSTDVIESEGL